MYAAGVKTLRQWLVRLFLHLAFAVLRFLPLGAVLALGRGLGGLACRLQPRRRERARQGLCRSLGLPEGSRSLEEAVRGVFTGLGMNLTELLWVAARPARLEERVVYDGLEHLRAARGMGKGVLVITGHLGSWEMLAAAMVHAGLPLTTIAREAADGGVNAFLLGLRSRLGVRTSLRGSGGAARSILRTLRDGDLLGALIDQDIRAEGTFVEFFGRPAFTPTGPVALALRAGAPVVLCCTWRRPDGRHQARFEPAVILEPGPDRAETIRSYTARFTRWIEERIREHPEQWVWIHRRWRRRPPDEAPARAAAN